MSGRQARRFGGTGSRVHGKAGAGIYRYFKFQPTALRTPGETIVQLTEWTLLNGTTIVPPVSVTGVNFAGNAGEAPMYAGDLVSTTKWCSTNGTSDGLIYDLGATTTVTGYRMQTGWDNPERDPVQWVVYGSVNGTTWTAIDTQTNPTVPTIRTAWTGDFTIGGLRPPATLATETWTGTNGAAWPGQWTTATNGGTVDIQNNQGRMLLAAGGPGPTALLSGMPATADTDTVVSFILPNTGGEYAFLSARADSFEVGNSIPTNAYTLVLLVSSTSTVSLQKNFGGLGHFIATDVNITWPAPGMVCKMRLRVQGTTIQGKVWDAAGAEPGTWMVQGTDVQILTGTSALSSMNGSGTVTWDDLTVTSIPSILNPDRIDMRLDFSTGDSSQFSAIECKTESRQMQEVTDHLRGSSPYTGRFEIAPGDNWPGNNSIRCMAAHYYTNETEGDDKWYGFSLFFPADTGSYNVIWEKHHRQSLYSTPGVPVAPHALVAANGDLQYRLETGPGWFNGTAWTGWTYYEPNITVLTGYPLNTWIDAVLHINYTRFYTGTVELWLRQGTNAWNTTPDLTRYNIPTLPYLPGYNNQVNGHPNDPAIPNDIVDSVYHEMGLYPGGDTIPATYVVYIAGHRRGTSKAAVMEDFPP